MVESRLGFVKAALDHLAHAHYNNVTRLARDVASFVSALEDTENGKLPEKYRKSDLKPVSHVTILRNSEYRRLLEAFLSKGLSNEVAEQKPFIDVEELLIRIKSLESQNKILKNKILNGSLEAQDYSEDDRFDAERQLFLALDFVISLVGKMQDKAPGCFYNATPDNDPKEKGPGFWGPYGLVESYEEMQKFEKVSSSLKIWRKNSLLD
ncbi:hypothetical protein H0H12_19560 [Pseudomonas putida]|uniref:Uncharacterized protein n=1 Tax=Pseudomonas putida TaxID=303 RepID=A0A7D5ZPE9_PSEPU|nr:hypothetical protein [Pseudomonas putida]QLJ12635.1 hypothetical protein H0H12_19560 [Pseudomonas putida]